VVRDGEKTYGGRWQAVTSPRVLSLRRLELIVA
jgi:hypothetical protein